MVIEYFDTDVTLGGDCLVDFLDRFGISLLALQQIAWLLIGYFFM